MTDMRIRPALALAILLLPSIAAAQGLSLNERRVVNYALRGVDHEFVLPSGWDGQGNENGFAFVPPSSRVKQPPFNMAVINVEKQAGFTGTSQQVAEWLANDDKTKSHPQWSTTTPDPMTFAGSPGTIIMLGGADEKGVQRAIMYVVSVTPTDIYYLRAEGALEDSKALAEDLVTIIGGVRRLDGAGAAPGARPGQANPVIRDPAWGLNVSGLKAAWDLRTESDAYVLTAFGKPEAEVRISRPEFKSKPAFEKQVSRGGRASKGTFAGLPAVVVDRTDRGGARIRTYYVTQKTFAFAFEVRAPDLDAMAIRVLQFEPAVSLSASSVLPKKRGGVSASMSGGVFIETTNKWKVGKMGAGRIWFTGPRGVMIEVKVFERGKVDPWEEVPATATQQCTLAGGKIEVSEIAVLGASKAMRYRCKARDAAALLTLAEGGGMFVRTVSQYQRVTAELPDAESAEFLTFLRFNK